MDKKKISLIIPHRDSEDQLIKVLNHIRLWTLYPNEILIIDSSKPRLKISGDFSNFCDENNISQKILFGDDLFPGAARNIGIVSAVNPVLAFLDVNTLPSTEWLRSGIDIINTEEIEGVWGYTYYEAETHTEKIIRASSYGQKPIRTLPGSIFYKGVFFKCGLFIEFVRGGEDGDWMSRVNLHHLAIALPKEKITYLGLSKSSYYSVIKKWHRNYLSASSLPSMKAHKDLYFYILTAFIVIAAFNWNWIMSNWDPNSIFYIPNVTKISIVSIFL
ncbi:uncharacterized protein METZ01_LOCUS315747, partial [marine metagenome]